jgi:hypothetical protein
MLAMLAMGRIFVNPLQNPPKLNLLETIGAVAQPV